MAGRRICRLLSHGRLLEPSGEIRLGSPSHQCLPFTLEFAQQVAPRTLRPIFRDQIAHRRGRSLQLGYKALVSVRLPDISWNNPPVPTHIAEFRQDAVRNRFCCTTWPPSAAAQLAYFLQTTHPI